MRRTADGSSGERRRAAGSDRVSLTAGIVLIVFGTILLLDRTGALHLTFAAMAPIALGAVGAVLLASGLARGT